MSHDFTLNNQSPACFMNEAGYINEANYDRNSDGKIGRLYEYPKDSLPPRDILVTAAVASSGVLNDQQTTMDSSTKKELVPSIPDSIYQNHLSPRPEDQAEADCGDSNNNPIFTPLHKFIMGFEPYYRDNSVVPKASNKKVASNACCIIM